MMVFVHALLQVAQLPSTAVGDSGARATSIGQPNTVAMGFFFAFISITLGITWWAARKTRTTDDFYAAGRSITAGQNGFALAGDYMSAASFLGIAGLVNGAESPSAERANDFKAAKLLPVRRGMDGGLVSAGTKAGAAGGAGFA